jgi:hypothetical protein
MIPHSGLSMGGPYAIMMLISRGMVGYHLTTIIIELRQFTGPHKSSIWLVHNQMLLQGSTTNGPQSTQTVATTLEPRISTYNSPTFPSNDTPVSHSCFAQSYMPVEPTTHLLLLGTTKHSTTNDTIYYKKG